MKNFRFQENRSNNLKNGVFSDYTFVGFDRIGSIL